VGSKWGYTYTADWRVDADVHEVKDLSIDTLRRQIGETREELGSHLDLYQIHSATLDSGVFEDRAVLDELARLRQGGLAIGFTVTGPRQRESIERALELDAFDAVQATWNLLEPSAGPALDAAHNAGLGVIVKEAVANGRLTARGDVSLLADLARDSDATPDALALGAVLARPWVDIVLSGATTRPMVESNLAAERAELDDELLERLGSLAEDRESYWETRSALAWN
jgi:aryl-alcohol dehydrogenase-like predicted oxidoreductase